MIRVLMTFVGMGIAGFSLWYLWKGADVNDWQEFARASFGVLAFIGLADLTIQIWK